MSYYEKLNQYEYLKMWQDRKYDYKCYPNQVLIKQYTKELKRLTYSSENKVNKILNP